MSNYKLLYITCGSKLEANKIGKFLVKNKMAACTNIIPNIQSIFKWNNKIKSSKEYILIGKTQKKMLKKLLRVLRVNIPMIVRVYFFSISIQETTHF